MRWLRSWPDPIPPHRAYVVDDMERLIIRDYDYSPLSSFDEDLIVCEWDIALGASDVLLFERRAREHADRVLVAPYLLYRPSPAHWAHRRVVWADQAQSVGTRWIQTQETRCDLFGFGLIYMPRDVLTAWGNMRAPGERFTDETFPRWHWSIHGSTPVCWDVRPVHLHY